MNKPITLCDRCEEYARCCLNYDGENCRRSRTVEPTNADRIRSMTDEELAAWLERIRLCCTTYSCGRNCPFAKVCYSSAAAPKEMLDWLKQEG